MKVSTGANRVGKAPLRRGLFRFTGPSRAETNHGATKAFYVFSLKTVT